MIYVDDKKPEDIAKEITNFTGDTTTFKKHL
jgi:hypothetical protein